MPFSSLVSTLRVDLTQFRKDWQEAEKIAREHHQRIQGLTAGVRIAGTVVTPGAGGAARLQTLGGAARASRVSRAEETVEQTAKRFLNEAYRDAGRQVTRDANDRSRKQRELDREEERIRRTVLREQARLAIQQGFATPIGAAGRRVEEQRRNARFAEDARRARVERNLQRAEERQAQTIVRQLGLPSRAQEAAQARQAVTRASRAQREEAARITRELGLPTRSQDAAQAQRAERERRAADQRDFRERSRNAIRDLAIRDREARQQERDAARFARGFAGGGRGPGGGPPRGPGGFGDFQRLIGQGLAGAFDRATRAANALSLITNVSLLGGLGGLVAEGIRLNSQFEKLNITMAATLGLSNDVVDAQGNLVTGPERTNFLLERTAGFYEVIRDVAARTIVGQQELTETVAENLALAQQAGFKLTDVSDKQKRNVVETIANIASLAKAIGLPGGQRQLSQEVRALFTGERLQGATITRLLGFRSVTEIQRLQSRIGPTGQTEFIEELGKRFQTVQPIIDKFERSMTGIFEALISQAKEFLRIATSTAFGKIREVLLGVRDNLTAEDVAAAATRLGNSIGEIVGHLIAFGRAAQPLFRLFGFIVDNATTLIAVWGAFRALRLLQGVSSAAGGAGGLTNLAAQIGGGALAARAGGGALSAGRGELAGFLGAAGAGGIGGAIRGQRALAAQGLAARATGGTLLGAMPGLFGTTGVTGIGIAGLLGAGIGTGLNFLTQGGPELLAERQVGGEGRRAEQVETRDLQQRLAEPILRRREQARALRRRAQELRSGQPVRQEEAEAPPLTMELFRQRSRFFTTFGLAQLLGERVGRGRVAELTDRVRPETLERRARVREEETRQQRSTAAELSLRQREPFSREERLRARLANMEVIRDREAALKIQAKLDQEAAIAEFTDKVARASKLVAIERKLQRDLRELREDTHLANREIIAEGLKDEETAIRIRTMRATLQAERNIRDPRERAAVIAGIELGGRRALTQQFITRQEEGAGARGELAELEGRTLQGIEEAGRRRLAAAARLRVEEKISTEDFHRFYRAIVADTARKEIEERRRIRDQALDFGMQIADITRREFQLRRDTALRVAQFEEQQRDRSIARVKERLQEEDSLRRAFQARTDARIDQSLFKARRGLEDKTFALFGQRPVREGMLTVAQAEQLNLGRRPGEAEHTPGIIRTEGMSIADEVRERTRIGLRKGGQFEGLTRGQASALTNQRTQEKLRSIMETLLGEGGVEAASTELGALGVKVDENLRTHLAEIALRAGSMREDERTFGRIREAQQVRERVVDADKGLIEAEDARREGAIQDRRAIRDEARDRQQITDDFRQAQTQLAIDFRRTQEAVILFQQATERAGVALDQGLTTIFRRFLGANVPAAEAGVAADAQRALDRAGAPRRTAPDNRRSDAGTVINLNGLQIGADTRELFEQLKDKLMRDARRTPVS